MARETLSDLLKVRYDAASAAALRRFLAPALFIEEEDGLVGAANRLTEGTDTTNYGAVWVRDSMWACLGLAVQEQGASAMRVLRRMLQYFASQPQRERIELILRNPQLVVGDEGAMAVPHIRFDRKSPTMDDVQRDGQAQRWDHKQNDALGLFYAVAMRAIGTGAIPWDDLSDDEREVLLRFPSYFSAIDYASMEDAGHWEEIERRNSSSVGLVLWGLEEGRRWIRHDNRKEEAAIFLRARGLVPEWETLLGPDLDALIEAGYATLKTQLPFESPSYETTDVRYRKADAALLALVVPARLERLGVNEHIQIVQTVRTLVRERGVLRYEGDAYQGAGYWKKAADPTGDHSTTEAFSDRASALLPNTEAQWFFDSWLSLACGRLFRETGEASWAELQDEHLTRALQQLTTDRLSAAPPLGADGKPVAPFAFPESYNVVIDSDGEHTFAPSPITPLQWAKACVAMALHSVENRDMQTGAK